MDRIRFALGALMVGTALLLGACGGSSDERKGALDSTAPTATTQGAGPDSIYNGQSAPAAKNCKKHPKKCKKK